MINTVTHEGVTYTRKGKAMSHAVITSSTRTFRPDGAPTVLVEWASREDLAVKNHSAQLARAEMVARTGALNGHIFDSRFYAPGVFLYSVMVEVTHS